MKLKFFSIVLTSTNRESRQNVQEIKEFFPFLLLPNMILIFSLNGYKCYKEENGVLSQGYMI